MPIFIFAAAVVTGLFAWTLRGISRAVNDMFGGTP